MESPFLRWITAADEYSEAAIATKIEQTCEKVAFDERFRRAVRQASQEPVWRNAADFGKLLAADYAIKGDIVKRAGVKPP